MINAYQIRARRAIRYQHRSIQFWKILSSVLAAALCFAGPPIDNGNSLNAQYGSEQQLSVGSILLSSEKLADPNFAESVVLILHYDADDGTVGLIINRRTEIPISRIFSKMKHASQDPVYMGGPVA